MRTHSSLAPAVAALSVVLTACGSPDSEPADGPTATATESAAAATTSTPSARTVEVGDRFSGPGTFRVGRDLTGLPLSIPPGEYRLTFGTDYATGEDYTAGMWIRCAELPCEPDSRDSLIDAGVVGVDSKTGEARSQSVAGDGSIVENGSTLIVERGDGALYLQGLSIQLLAFR